MWERLIEREEAFDRAVGVDRASVIRLVILAAGQDERVARIARFFHHHDFGNGFQESVVCSTGGLKRFGCCDAFGVDVGGEVREGVIKCRCGGECSGSLQFSDFRSSQSAVKDLKVANPATFETEIAIAEPDLESADCGGTVKMIADDFGGGQLPIEIDVKSGGER